MQTGDIVLRAAGRDIETSLDLQRVVGSQSLGTVIPVDVLRNGNQVPLQMAVAEAQKHRTAAEPVSISVHEKVMPLGLELRAMNTQEQRRLGFSDGLYVESVAAPTPPVRAELKAGDLILQVRGRPIRRVADFRDGVESAAAEGAPVAVLTMRGDERRFVALELDR
jgi:serine protease Do